MASDRFISARKPSAISIDFLTSIKASSIRPLLKYNSPNRQRAWKSSGSSASSFSIARISSSGETG